MISKLRSSIDYNATEKQQLLIIEQKGLFRNQNVMNRDFLTVVLGIFRKFKSRHFFNLNFINL